MFRFLLRFIYVLYIFINSSQSSSVLASFNESCSDHISCTYPLICSNTSKCVCSKPSSIWNIDQNDCLYCPPGWIEWENNHCLSLAVPSEGGVSYDQANETCLSLSAQLFSMYNIDQFKQMELRVNTLLNSTFSSAVTIFFRLGAWIDKFDVEGSEDIWCNENEKDPTSQCVFITKTNFKNGSLCLSRLQCDAEIPFICDMEAISEKNTVVNENSAPSEQRFIEFLTALEPIVSGLLGNLLGGNSQPQQTPPPPSPPPQQIIIQQDPAAHAASSDNTILYVGLGVGGFLLLLLICCAAGAFIYFAGCSKNSSSNEQANQRSSVESSSSYA